jgi:hypothetical protein
MARCLFHVQNCTGQHFSEGVRTGSRYFFGVILSLEALTNAFLGNSPHGFTVQPQRAASAYRFLIQKAPYHDYFFGRIRLQLNARHLASNRTVLLPRQPYQMFLPPTKLLQASC